LRSLESHYFIASPDYIVHILHSGNWAHFGTFLFSGLNTGAAGVNPAAGLQKFIRLFDSVKLIRADFLILNAFSHEENFSLILLTQAKIRISQGIPARFRVVT